MKRRQGLRSTTGVGTVTAGSTVLAAGCLFSPGPRYGYNLTLEPFTDDSATDFLARDVDQLDPRQTEVIEDLRDDDVASMLGKQAFENETHVHVDDSYVRIVVEHDGTERVSRPVLTAGGVDEPPADEQAVAMDRYRSDAQRLVERAVVTAHRGAPEEVVLDPDTQPAELDPEPEHRYVEYQGEKYRLSIDNRMVAIDRYRYEWDEVATTRDEFSEYLREAHYVADADEADLSAEGRNILAEAKNSPPYEATAPFDDAEEEVLDLLDVDRQDVGEVKRFLRFEGSYYRARIHWWHSD